MSDDRPIEGLGPWTREGGFPTLRRIPARDVEAINREAAERDRMREARRSPAGQLYNRADLPYGYSARYTNRHDGTGGLMVDLYDRHGNIIAEAGADWGQTYLSAFAHGHAAATPYDDTHPCADCGQTYYERMGSYWLTDSALWAEVVDDVSIVLCPRCFVRRAGAKGIRLYWTPVRLP